MRIFTNMLAFYLCYNGLAYGDGREWCSHIIIIIIIIIITSEVRRFTPPVYVLSTLNRILIQLRLGRCMLS